MRASTGVHYPKLDHVRAIAAIVVYYWHTTHMGGLSTAHVPAFMPFSLLEEGWIGVSLFMTLSGYIFAKIIGDGEILYGAFLWNRFIRLAPLLTAVLAYFAFVLNRLRLEDFLVGFYQRGWPSGAWSVAVEFHFYLIFPLLLFIQRRWSIWVLALTLVISNLCRAGVWAYSGEVQSLSYWTIIGRFDQFVIGMLLYSLADAKWISRHAVLLLIGSFAVLVVVWSQLNWAGGFYWLGGSYPSPSSLWIVLPAIEATLLGLMMIAYERAQFSIPGALSLVAVAIGEASYSLYLLHRLLVRYFVDVLGWGMPDHFGAAALVATVLFPPVALVSMLSYRLIERPFLRFRVPYIRRQQPISSASPKLPIDSTQALG